MVWDSARTKILAVLLTLLLISVIIVLAMLRPTLIYEPPFLITALNLLFLTVLPFTVAYLAWRSYTASGVPSILLLGAGLIAFGCGSLVAGFTIYLPGGTNLTPTIHNSGALLGSLLITLGAIFARLRIKPEKALVRAKLYAGLIYAGAFAIMTAISLMAIAGLMPTFFVQGAGPTIVRQVVLGAAVVLFTVSSVIYLRLYQTVRTYYVFWCGMGFILIAVGLAAVFLQAGVGSLIGWAGRVAQYLGCLYLFIGRGAVVIIAGEKHITEADEITNLHRMTANYETLVEIASDAIISIDEKGYILTWNTAAERIFGPHKHEAIGRLFTSVIGRCPLTDYLDAKINTGNHPGTMPAEIVSGEFAARRKNDELFQAEISVAGSKDSGSRIFTLIIKDITERKQAQEALRESKERHREIFDSSSDALVIQDIASGSILDVNKTMLKIYGYADKQEVLKCTIEDLSALDEGYSKEKIIEMNQKAIDSNLNSFEWRAKKKNGEKFWAQVTLKKTQIGGESRIMASIRDITGRMQAEDALRREKIMLTRTEDIASIGSWEWDIATDTVTWSDELFRIFQRDPQEGAPSFAEQPAFYHPDDFALLRQAVEVAIASGTPYKLELRAIRKDGETRVCMAHGAVETATGGKPVRLFGSLQDITERRQAEEALRENQQKFQALVETTNDFIWEMNLNGVYTYCSPQIEKLWGLKPQEMLGKTPFELLPPEEKEQATKLFTALLGSASNFTNMEMRSFDGSGQVRFLEISGVPFTDKEGRLAGYRGITRDITGRKRDEIALRESEQRLSSIYNTAGDVIYYLEVREGENYRFVSVNPAFCKVTGLPQEAVIGKRVDEVVPEPSLSVVLGKYRQAIGDKTIVRWEETSDYPTGRMTAEVCISPVFDDTGYCQYLVGSVHDITDRKRLEEEQQRVAKLESVGLLAGGIAHDFNNILTSILGNISLAGMEATPGSELQNSLEQAEKASQRAKALTVQLLTFSKGGAPVLKLASLTELIKDTAGFALSGSNVKCHLAIPAGLWHAEVDAGQVSQVIHNLVLNAQQAMPTGGSVEIGAENIALSKTQSLGRGLPLKEGDYVRIAITDNGIGIPEDHLEKIFDPFFTTKQKGNGMGLAISFSIARQHGGHISVESDLGTGSTFYLYLPASTETVTPEHVEKKAIKPAAKARILVMDDEKGVREIAGRMLRHIGYKDIEFAEDGAEAIELYKTAMKAGNSFNAAILDLTIAGGMGGEETIRKLLKIDPGIKAIVSSGYIDDPVIAKYRDFGFSGMVAKPYTIAELRKAVQDVIG